MNSVSRKSLDWHPHKAAGNPGLPNSDMFIKMFNMNIMKGFFCYKGLESQQRCWICRLCVAVFQRENNKELTFHVCCCGQLCSWCSLSSAEILPVEWSDADWDRITPSPFLYINAPLYKQDIRFSQLVEKRYVGKWQSLTPHHTGHVTPLAHTWRTVDVFLRPLAACWRFQGPLPRGENWWVRQTQHLT
jgi:hypothetical protein